VTTPGSSYEGGELSCALVHAFGAVMDNPDLLAYPLSSTSAVAWKPVLNAQTRLQIGEGGDLLAPFDDIGTAAVDPQSARAVRGPGVADLHPVRSLDLSRNEFATFCRWISCTRVSHPVAPPDSRSTRPASSPPWRRGRWTGVADPAGGRSRAPGQPWPTGTPANGLFVSPKTVDVHLSRVFAKFGISTRAAIRDHLDGA
jgi:hypothetical protein